MTTFDDTDFFTDAFTGFGADQAPRRRSTMLTGLVLVAAAALVAGGMVAVRLAQQPRVASVDPATMLAVFGEPQRSADVVDADDLTGSLLDPSSTRLLAETSDTRYYAGVSRTHLLCVLAVTAGDLPTTGRTSTDAAGVTFTVDDRLMLVTAGGRPGRRGRLARGGPQVYLKD